MTHQPANWQLHNPKPQDPGLRRHQHGPVRPMGWRPCLLDKLFRRWR